MEVVTTTSLTNQTTEIATEIGIVIGIVTDRHPETLYQALPKEVGQATATLIGSSSNNSSNRRILGRVEILGETEIAMTEAMTEIVKIPVGTEIVTILGGTEIVTILVETEIVTIPGGTVTLVVELGVDLATTKTTTATVTATRTKTRTGEAGRGLEEEETRRRLPTRTNTALSPPLEPATTATTTVVPDSLVHELNLLTMGILIHQGSPRRLRLHPASR